MASQKRESEETQPETSKVAKLGDFFSDWLKSVANYTKDAQATVLDLSCRKLQKEEVKLILNSLAESQVTELNLADNYCLENSMADLAPLLTRTKVQKLNISDCKLSKDDIFQLVELLKDTQISDLIINDYSCSFTSDEGGTLISNLLQSKLTTLRCAYFFDLLPQSTVTSFFQDFSNTPISSLDLTRCELSPSDLFCLFSNLGRSSVTDLNLDCLKETDRSYPGISSVVLQDLNRGLVETNIEKLNLRGVCLDSNKLSSLVQGLMGSKVTDLNLEGNLLTCVDSLLSKLKETQIRTLKLDYHCHLTFIYADSLRCSSLASLDLSRCYLSDEQGEALMESLRLSNVTKLNVSRNRFGLLTAKKLADNISDINLVDLDISSNDLTREGVFILGECLRESKLTRINVSLMELNNSDLLPFLKLTEGSSVSQIEMSKCFSSFDSLLDSELNTLANTPLTGLHLADCHIPSAVLSSLISCLKHTITHLDFSKNHIGDDGAAVLAECLKDTQIRRLKLELNSITNEGSKALALSLKETNLLYLDLRHNKIKDDDVEFFAEHAEDSLVTELNFESMGYELSRKSILLIDKVLWDNKLKVHKLVAIFKKLALFTNNNDISFDRNAGDVDVSAFLEELLGFYKTVVDKPKVITVLLEDESVSYSRAEISRLLFEEFPRQLSSFIACTIEGDLAERVRILEKAEEMGLSAIVESLLLHRPVFTIDEEQGILHPNVYRLLLKYKQPVCNLDVEPDGVTKIIQYFTEHADVEGGQDLIEILRGANNIS